MLSALAPILLVFAALCAWELLGHFARSSTDRFLDRLRFGDEPSDPVLTIARKHERAVVAWECGDDDPYDEPLENCRSER